MAANWTLSQVNTTSHNTGNGTNMSSSDYYYVYEDYTDCGEPVAMGSQRSGPFGILVPLVSCGGIIGILMTVIVLSRKSMSTSTNCYLTSLALADLFFLIILATKYLDTKIDVSQSHLFVIYWEYANVLLNVFLVASIWVTVMLAVERYIAICHPLRAMTICTVQRCRGIIIMIFVLSLLYRIPMFFENYVVTFHCYNTTIYEIKSTALKQNLSYHFWYYTILESIISAALPFVALLFLNLCLILEIHKSTKYLRYHLAGDSNLQTIISCEQTKITMMLVSIIIVFFICQAPYMIITIIKYQSNFKLNSLNSMTLAQFMILQNCTILLIGLKSSFNFVLYCWFSEKFWNTFKNIFCMQYCAPKQPNKRCANGGHTSDLQGVPNGCRNVRKISYYTTKETTC